MELEGKIFAILPVVTGTSPKGTWKKQEIVLEIPGEYPKKVMMSAWGAKAEIINSCKVGDAMKASFDLESREYNGRWYTEVRIWKLERAMEQGVGMPVADDMPFNDPIGATFSSGEEDYVF